MERGSEGSRVSCSEGFLRTNLCGWHCFYGHLVTLVSQYAAGSDSQLQFVWLFKPACKPSLLHASVQQSHTRAGKCVDETPLRAARLSRNALLQTCTASPAGVACLITNDTKTLPLARRQCCTPLPW